MQRKLFLHTQTDRQTFLEVYCEPKISLIQYIIFENIHKILPEVEINTSFCYMGERVWFRYLRQLIVKRKFIFDYTKKMVYS